MDRLQTERQTKTASRKCSGIARRCVAKSDGYGGCAATHWE